MFAPRGWLSRPLARRIYRTIDPSELFDRGWYRSQQMQGVAKLSDPLWHFLAHGRKRHLDPSPMFDTEHYLSTNPDVRDSNLNPLFHYLEYGIGERRQPLRSAQETFDWLFPDAAELPTYLVPHIGTPRLTVLIDRRALERSDVSISEILVSAGALAKKNSRALRVISVLSNNEKLMETLGELHLSATALELDVVTAPAHRETTHYDIHEDEVFLATSWTSASALRFAGAAANLWCLAPEGTGTKRATRGYVLSSPQLWRQWSLGDTPTTDGSPASKGAPRPAVKAQRDGAGEQFSCTIVRGENSDPERYAWTLREVEHMVRQHPSFATQLSITLVGPHVRGVNFLHSLQALVTDKPASAIQTQSRGNLVITKEGPRPAVLEFSTADLLREGELSARLREFLVGEEQ
jgi:hypothetical protein